MRIKIDHLVMKYKSFEALNIPSLELNEGTAYGFVGHNGAGKKT